MSGYECLKAELINRGFNKVQAESKVVVGVLDILSNSNGEYSDMYKLNQEIQAQKKQIEIRKMELNHIRNQYDTYVREAQRLHDEYKKYIDDFLKAISECETAEGRDALKAAQMFVNSVSVDTKYDNTAFIIGLAQILAQGKTGAIDELRKINSRIPNIGERVI